MFHFRSKLACSSCLTATVAAVSAGLVSTAEARDPWKNLRANGEPAKGNQAARIAKPSRASTLETSGATYVVGQQDLDDNLGVLLDRSYGAATPGAKTKGVRSFIPGIDGFVGDPKWQPHVEFTAAPGGRSLGQVNLFAPLAQDADSLLFADLRASVWTDDVQEGNFGAGYRQIVPGGFFGTDAIFGVYGFLDARNSANNNKFYQGTFGAELITEHYEFRANGYLPSGNQYTVGVAGAGVALDGFNVVNTGVNLVERALPGFDVEAGVKIDFSEAAIRLNAGYFRFERGDTLVEGPRFRAEVEIDDPFGWEGAKLSLGGEIRDDKVRGTEASGILRLRVPIGGPSVADRAERQLTGLDRLMTRRVYRDDDIVTPVVRGQNTQTLSPVTDAATGQTLQAFFVANTAQGAGDCSNVGNACEFVTAQGLAGAGDTFLPVDVAGAIGSVFTLNANRQQVIGAGDTGSATIVLSDSANSVLIVTSLGGRPIVTGVNIGHFADTRIAGLNTNSATGIIGNGFTGSATINDVRMFNGGLNFTNSAAAISVTDTDINNGTSTGIALSGFTGSASFANVDVTSAGGAGLSIDAGAGSLTFDADSSLTQSGTGAVVEVLNSHSGTLNSAAVVNASNGDGMQFNNADGTYNFNGPSNLNGGDAGIDILNDSAGTFTFGSDTAITSPTGIAFNVDGSSATVAYNGSITQNNGASAVSGTNNTGGTVTFGGRVTANTAVATGVNLVGNTGAAFAFDGGLDIDTTTGTGFNATGGGTISVAASAGDESITVTAGQALNLNGVTIGAGGVSFDAISSSGSAATGIGINGVGGGAFMVSGATMVSGSTGNGIQLTGNSAAISFAGATSVTMTNAAAAIGFSSTSSGAVTFADLDIALQSDTSRGLDFSSAIINAPVSFGDFDLTSTSTVGTTGIDLSGTTGTGTIQVGDTDVNGASASIAGVNVGVQFTAGTNATFVFGDGEGVTDKGSAISATTAIAGGSTVLMGSYDFDDVNFTGVLDFAAGGGAGLVFVAATATGDGSGSDVNNRANVITADAIAAASTTFVLINDGAAIDDVDGFTLVDGQTMASFGNGRTFASSGLIIPANFSGVPGAGATITDPTGNGAAILTRTGGAGDTLTASGTVNLQDFILENTAAGDGLAATGATSITSTGLTIQNVAMQGIDLDNLTGTATFNNTKIATTTGNAIDSVNSAVSFTGGLDIDTTTGVGLSATGGGTISVAATAGDESIIATAGQALNLNGVTLGAGGVNFDSISSAGSATTGININGVGGGAFTVSGTTTVFGSTGNGIQLTGNAAAIQFGVTNIAAGAGAGQAGIDFAGVNTGTVTFGTTTISNVGAAANQKGIDFNGATLGGTVAFDSVAISGPNTSTTSIGVDLTGVLGDQIVNLGSQTDPATGPSSSINNLHRGVVIDNTAAVQFTFGDGESASDTGSSIDVNSNPSAFTVDAGGGTLAGSSFDFNDVAFGAGDGFNFPITNAPVFVSIGGGVVDAGTNNLNQDVVTIDVGTAEAAADTDQVFVFVGNGMGNIDLQGGGADGFTLDPGQSITSFNDGNTVSLGTSQPVNIEGNFGIVGVTSDNVTAVNNAGGATSVIASNTTGNHTIANFDISTAATGVLINGNMAAVTLTNVGIAGIGGTGIGVSIQGAQAAIGFNDVDISGTATGIDIQNGAAAGDVTIDAASSITNTATRSINLDQNVSDFTFAGTISETDGTGAGIFINQLGGAASFSGAVALNTGAAIGVNLTTNTGSVGFTGGLDIDTTTGIGFNATGGGAVSIAATAGDESITSTAAQALNLDTVSIGAGGVSFDTVSSTSAGSGNAGIRLNALTGAGSVDITNARVVNSGGAGGGHGIELTGIGMAGALTIANIDIDMPVTGGNSLRGIYSFGGHTSAINLGTGAGGVAIDDTARGIQFEGTAGTINVGTGAGSGGVQLNTLGTGVQFAGDSTGTITIGNTTTASTILAGTVTGTAPAISTSQSDATITMTGIDINGAGNVAGGHGIELTDNDGDGLFTLNGVNTIDNVGGDAIRIQGAHAVISGVTIGASATDATNDITGNGVNVSDNGQNHSVSINTVTVADARGAGIKMDGSGAGSITVNSFNGNTITDADVRGVDILDVTFDAVTGGAIQQVTGGNLSVGAIGNRVEGDGVRLDQVLGDIAFGTVDIFNNNGTGLFIRDAAGKGGTFAFGNTGGTINTTTGAAVDIDPVTMSSTFANLTSTNSAGRGVNLDTIAGTFTVTGTTSVTGSTTEGVRVANSNAAINLGTLNVSGITGDAVLLQNNTGGSFTASGGSVTNNSLKGLYINGGAMDVAFGADITQNGGFHAVDVSGTTAEIAVSGNITKTGTGNAIDVRSVASGTVSFTGSTINSSSIIQIANTANAGAVKFSAGTALTINNFSPLFSINLVNNTGAIAFNGAVDINNAHSIAIRFENSNANVSFAAVDIEMSNLAAAANKDAISIGGTPGVLTFGATTITQVGAAAGQKGIDFSGTTLGGAVNFESVAISGPDTSTDSIGVDLTGVLGDQIVNLGNQTDPATGPSSSITDLHRGVVINTTAAVQFTFGDGESASDTGSSINVNGQAGAFTVDAGGGTLAGSSFDFNDVAFGTGDGFNFPTANVPVFVSIGGGLVNAGTNNLNQDLTTIDVAAAEVLANTGQVFVFVGNSMGNIDLQGGGADGFTLDPGQSITSFNDGNTVSLGTSQPVNIEGNFGIAAVTSDNVTAVNNAGGATSVIASNATGNHTIANLDISTAATGVLISGNTLAVTLTNVGIAGIAGAGIGVSIQGAQAAIAFNDVDISGTATGIDIQNGTAAGDVTIDTVSSITNTATRSINLDQNVSDFTFAGTISEADGIGSGIFVNLQSTGVVTFSGAAALNTGASNGIELTNNTGGTINFTGGLDIDTTTGIGLSATGGGTVNVTAGAMPNTVTATAGQAVLIDGIAGDLNFTSLASTNTANNAVGIANFATGSSFTVSGAVSIMTPGDDGIDLNNVGGNVTFGGAVNITTPLDDGIDIEDSSNGTIIFQSTVTISDAFDSSVEINGFNAGPAATGTIAFNGLLDIDRSSGAGINIFDRVGAVSFANVDIDTVGVGGVVITDALLDGPLSFGQLDVNGGPGSQVGLGIARSSGTIDVNGGTIENIDGEAIGLVDASVTLTYTGTVMQVISGAELVLVNSGDTSTVTFEAGSILQAGNGIGLQFDNAAGSYNFAGTTTLNGGDAGIDIVNGSTGTFTFGAGTAITSPTGIGFNVDSSAATVTHNGTITQNNAASAVSITNNPGGTATFAGLVTANTSTATAVNLMTNTGSTAFTGGLDIDTTSGIGFNATGGGTVSVAATAGDESILSTAGQALNLNGVTLGAGGVNFDSISSAGSATTGININGVGGGAFTVSGTTTVSGSTGNGIQLTGNAVAIQFGVTNIAAGAGAGQAGIDFAGVNTGTVTFGTTTISNVGAAANQKGIDFNGATLGGAVNFESVAISGPDTSTDSIGVDLRGVTGNQIVNLGVVGGADSTTDTPSSIDNLHRGVVIDTTAAVQFTFGDGFGDGAPGGPDEASSINVNANPGAFTVDVGGGTLAASSFDFNDVSFTGTANLPTAAGNATFVSQAGGTIGVGTFGLTQSLNTVTVSAADAIATAGTVFVFVGNVDIGGANGTGGAAFSLADDQSINGFGNTTSIAFGTAQPANVEGSLGATGGNVTGDEATVTNSSAANGLFTITGGSVQNTTFDLAAQNAGIAMFTNTATTGEITFEGITVTNIGAGRVFLDSDNNNNAAGIAIRNNNINIAGALLDVDGGTAPIAVTRGTLPNGGPAGTLTIGLIDIDGKTGGTVAITDATVNSGTQNAVVLTSNTGATINFAGLLDIDTTTGTGFTATGGGTVTVAAAGNTTVNSTGGQLLNLDGVTTNVTFDSLTGNGGGTAAGGIVLNNLDANSAFTATGTTTLDNYTGNGIAIGNLSAAGQTINFAAVSINTTVGQVQAAGDGISINTVSSTGVDIDFGAVTIGNGTNQSDTGISISNVTAAANDIAIDIASLSLTNLDEAFLVDNFDAVGRTIQIAGTTNIADARSNGIEIINSDGNVSFNDTTTILNDAGGANASGIDLGASAGGANTGTYSFNGLDVTVNGAGAFGLRATNSGTVNVADPGGTNQVTSNNGTAVFINPTAINMTFASVTSSDSAGSGVDIDGGDATGGAGSNALTIGTLNVRRSAGAGLRINNSTGTFNFGTTTIDNVTGGATAGGGVDIDATDGAGDTLNVNFTNGLEINTTSGDGFDANVNVAPNVFNLQVANAGTKTINTTTGQVLDLLNTNATGAGINFDSLTSIGTVSDDVIAIDLESGTFNGGNVTIAGTTAGGQDGIFIGSGGAGATINFASATIDSAQGGAINFNTASNVTFTTVDIDGGGTGIGVSGSGILNINGGSIGATTSTTGRAVQILGSGNTVNIAASATKSTSGQLILVQSRTGGTVTLSGNLSASGAAEGILVQNNTGGTITFSGTTKTLNTGANDAVSLSTNGATAINFSGGTLNIDTVNGTGFDSTNGGGTVTITDVLTIDVTGTGTGLNVIGGSLTANNAANTIAVVSGEPVNIAGATVNATFATVSASALNGNKGIDIDSHSGTLTINGGTITNTGSQDSIEISGGSGTISIATSVNSTGATGLAFDVSGRTGGTVTLSGNLIDSAATGGGISASGNTGGTINFSGTSQVINTATSTGINLANSGTSTVNFTGGGLDIDTTSGAGFTATGGGTVTVQDTDNSVTSTTGTAVIIANTTIGGLGVMFQSVSSTGAVNGIVLNTTGAGGFTVTGVGTTNGSGGTITGGTGDAIRLFNTSNVTLENMNILSSGGNGVFGTAVNGFAIRHSIIRDNGDSVNESQLRFADANPGAPVLTGGTGTFVFDNILAEETVAGNNAEHLVEFINISGTMNLTVSNSTFQGTVNSGLGADGFLIETRSFAISTVNVTGSTFQSNATQGFQGSAIDNSELTVNIGTSSILNNNEGIVLSAASNANLTFDINNNTEISGHTGTSIFVGTTSNATSASRVTGHIRNNSNIVNNSAVNHGIIVFPSGDSVATVNIENNTITGAAAFRMINVTNTDANGDFTDLAIRVVGNNVTNSSGANNFNDTVYVEGDQDATVCAIISGNLVSTANGRDHIRLRERDPGTTVTLEQGAASLAATADAALVTNNPATPGAQIDGEAGVAVVANGFCRLVP